MTDVHENVDEILATGESPIGTMLVERVLQEVLRFGFDAITKDPSLVDDILYKLGRDARNDIKNYLEGRKITVALNIPQDPLMFPSLAILSAADSETESMDALGDYFGDEEYLGGAEGGEIFGHALQSEYQVLCLAGKDSNAVLWLYYLAKALLLLNRDTLHVHGLHNVTMSGQDVTFREDLLPEFSYTRMLRVSCTHYFAVRKTQRVANKVVVSLKIEQPFSATTHSLEETL